MTAFPSNTLYISMDEKKRLTGGMSQIQFISQTQTYREQKSKVFKDYILSPEAYTLN